MESPYRFLVLRAFVATQSVFIRVNPWLLVPFLDSGLWILNSELSDRMRYGRSADFSSNCHVGDVRASPFTAPTPSA